MKKILSLIVFLFGFFVSFGQPIVNRAGQANTVADARLQATLNFFVPRFADTTAANLQKGIDSSGAMIFAYNTNSLWVRAISPKRWVEVSAGSSVQFIDSLRLDTAIDRSVIVGWGNSLTAAQPGYVQYLSKIGEHLVISMGVNGEVASQITTRFLNDTARWKNTTIIWAGRNNIPSTSSVSVVSSIQQIVSALQSVGNNNYVVLDILNGQNEGIGTTNYDSIIALNNRIHSTFPGHVGNLRQFIVSKYNPLVPQDVIDYAQDIMPFTLRSDAIHPNTLGYNWVAYFIDSAFKQQIYDTIGIENPISVNQALSLFEGQLQNVNLSTKGSYNISNISVAYVPDPYFAPNSLIYGNGGRRLIAGSTNNTVTGFNSYLIGSTGGYNALYGSRAAPIMTTGSRNAGFGDGVFFNAVAASDNAGFGYNVFISAGAGSFIRSTAIGAEALRNIQSGADNFAGGQVSQYNCTTCSDNTSAGRGSLYTNQVGSRLTAIGSASLQNNIASDNTASAYQSMFYNSSGFGNTGSGVRVFYSNQTGIYNTGSGYMAGWGWNAAGQSTSYNSLFGAFAGYQLRAGANHNIFIGYKSVTDSVTGSNSIVIGDSLEIDRTESDQINIGGVIFSKGGTGKGLSVGAGRVGIGIRNPDASAKLDITSTTQGFLPPRMTAVQRGAIVSPVAGLIVYDTDSSAHFGYTGSVWYRFGGSGGGGGGVTSVSGTTNRITSTGGTTPVIDISSSYVGQASITTLGTIGTGTWNGTAIGTTYGGSPTGGTTGQVLTKNSGTDYDYSWATPSGGGGSVFSALTAATGTNTINNAAFAQEWQWNSLAGASGLKLSSTSTAAASNAQRLFEVDLSGANGTSAQTTYAGSFSNTHTGTTSVNVAGYFNASGGTTNYDAMFNGGRVSFGGATVAGGATDATGSVQGSYFRQTDNAWGGLTFFPNANYATKTTFGYQGIQSNQDLTFIAVGGDITLNATRTYVVGNLGIGITTPTARFNIAAGTATANTAPLKFTSGTNLTTPESGAMEYDGSKLYFTPNTITATRGNVDVVRYDTWSAGAFGIVPYIKYHYYTGTVTTTATMPTIANNSNVEIVIINQGTQNVDIVSSAGANDLWENGAASNLVTLLPGASAIFHNNGTYWSMIN